MNGPCFFHVDLDAFFASVEQLDNPEYRGKPVIVGSLPADRRGVVSTCSYEARRYGVHSAMPIGRAFKLCPSGIFLRGRMKRYHEKSREVMAILNRFSPDVRQMSIDEAFMDMGGTERLFGPPESAARRLKESVREETGLTLSIGAASNKYIAKIASGMSKPDGLFIVQSGKEEDFMLSLPLKKIWGVGEKTLERLTSAGFKTPRDVHKASLNLLQSLFGSCTGSFLYHAVRGCEVETFEAQTKSRSISSEHTFSFDLSDLYTIDTALLELSWELMYRLLTENVQSKTVHVKIRYEDFTTVSIQETSGRFISSADDLFLRAQNLFRKKYENGRGIRLLGLAAQNIEDTTGGIQSELFDFGEKKKAAVEKAVIQIQKKNPAVRVEKARLLHAKEELQPNKTPAQKIKPEAPQQGSLLSAVLPAVIPAFLCFFLSCVFFCFSIAPLYALPQGQGSAFSNGTDDIFNPLAALPPGSPFASFSLASASDEVELFVQGSWEAKFFGHHIIGGGTDTNKKAPVFSFSPPVFMQKTDLTLWFFLNRKWYFEAAVADAYDKSTVAAGYYGEGFLRHARIGNRGIHFPRIYGVDAAGKGAGGAADQAPGIAAHWEAPSWQADALLRYDLLETFEKNWAGANELGEKKIALYEWKAGLRFALPASTAARIASVYVESEKGDYKDSEGYTYVKLAPSDYLILAAQDVLVLARAASGRVLAEFYGEKNAITGPLGNFSAAGSFLKEVQDCFGSKYELKRYSYPQKAGVLVPDNFFTNIAAKAGGNAAEALILQYPPFFSPFADASLYEADFAPNNAGLSVLTAAGTAEKGYAALEAEGSIFAGVLSGSDFFKEKKNYIRLFNRAFQNTAGGSPYQGIPPAERYPAAKDAPLVYLSPKAFRPEQAPFFISVQTSSRTEALDIGSEAVPGSIVMYRNGIKETGFRYDEKTGIVHPIRPITAFDKVRIVWQQRKDGGKIGRISAAAGIQKRFSDDFRLDGSASFLWPLTQKDSFSYGSDNAAGSLNAALKLDLQKKDFSLSDTSVLSFEMPDTTGVRRVLGMDGSKPKKILLAEKAAVSFPEGIVPVLKQRPEDMTPPSGVFSGLDLLKRGSLKSKILREEGNEGYAVGMDWTIEQAGGWAVQTIDFSKAAASLASAREFSLLLKTSDAKLTNAQVYLQLGAPETAAASSVLGESQVPLPTWEITKDSPVDNDVKQKFDISAAKKGIWQKVAVRLRDEDRMQLAKAQNARLIIYFPDTVPPGTFPISGKLFAGAAEINGTVFALHEPDGCTLHSSGQSSPVAQTADMLRFNRDGVNTVQYFKWHIPSGETPKNGTVSARVYTEELNLASYDTLNFFMYMPEIASATAEMPDFSLVLQSETNRGIKTALHIVIKKEGLEKIKSAQPPHGAWKKVQFDLRSRSLRVDDTELTAETEFSVQSFDINIAPNRIDFLFAPCNTPLPAQPTIGELYIDELYLEGLDYRLNFENIFSFDWGKNAVLWEVEGFPLAANPRFYTNIHAHTASGNLRHRDSTASAAAAADTRAQIDIAGIEAAGNISFSLSTAEDKSRIERSFAGAPSAGPYLLQSAGHRIRTTPVFFVTKIFNVYEDYAFTPQSKSAKKTEILGFDFSPLKLPLFVSFRTEGSLGALFQKQDSVFEARYSLEKEGFSYTVRAEGRTSQQGQNTIQKTGDKTGYFSSWLDVSRIQFSSGESSADMRRIGFSLEQGFAFFENRLRPSVLISAQNVYSSALKTEHRASDSFSVSVPFSIKNQQFSAAWTKNASVSGAVQKGGSYVHDSRLFAESMSKRKDSYAALPLYDFFDPALALRMQKSGASVSAYESMWDLSWKRPLFSSPLDIAVPSRLSFGASRVIKTSSHDISDMLQFKTGAGFTAFNCFGSFGSMRLCHWYEQDEFASFLSLTFKTDRGDIKKYRIDFSGYNQALLFFNAKDNLRFFTEYRVDTQKDWQVKAEAEWNRIGKTSIVKDALEFLLLQFNKVKKAEGVPSVSFRRKNTLKAVFAQTGAQVFVQNYGLSHHADFDLNSYLRAGLFLETELTVKKAAFTLKNGAGISGKISF
ncbi:DNA polymerase IV [Treponema sp. HNW]|uniref:DNA polymerase IV n=1 Tax=Treponema sp. HNW TaxID=3116654 RepID=UPI003D11FC3B